MLLKLDNITKVFGEARVLNNISLSLDNANLLGLVGENGAGKSTLMNILGGIFPPSDGNMQLQGKIYQPTNPQEAIQAGIAFIHQELNLFPNLSIAENLHLANFPARKLLLPWIDRKQTQQHARALLQRVGLQLDPRTLVEDLTPAQKQLLEIAKALSTNPRLIIFDEPTTSLTRHEVEILFRLIGELKADGLAIIFISHNLEDVLHLADQIAVLRDGELVAYHKDRTQFRLSTIIQQMVGRDMAQYFPEKQACFQEETLLQVQDMRVSGLLQGISFRLRRQEILGFYGLVGAGRSEMARCLFGLDPMDAGTVSWKVQPVDSLQPHAWIARKVAFLTEDRRDEGLLMSESIQQNIGLAALPSFAQGLLSLVNRREVSTQARVQASATHTRYEDLGQQAVGTLSGGNQQKVVLGKWLLIQPELLIMDEPTKGIDIGAKHEIYKLMQELVKGGASILLISSEIEELLGLCDRILVMKQGRISAEFTHENFSREAILEAALHNETPAG
jgi:ABC-type sugar transport system ATPase subunit